MEEQKPGEVIVPLQEHSAEQPAAAIASTPAETPSQPPITAHEQPPVSIPEVQEEVPYYPDTPAQSPAATQPQPSDDGIHWEADEYIAPDKTGAWYGAVIAASAIIAAVVYLLNRDIITSLMVFVALAGLAAFSGRRPRRQQFVVAPEGIQVGRMFYSFTDFRSFAVAEEKTGHSLILVSLKRFVPAINIYIPDEYEEAVVNLVASILPMEPHTPDFVERLMSRIHF
jgi:hypothetical protein